MEVIVISTPASFAVTTPVGTSGSGIQAVGFPIPAGTWTSGTWSVEHSVSNIGSLYCSMWMGHYFLDPGQRITGDGSYSESIMVGTDNLTAINNAAGGLLATNYGFCEYQQAGMNAVHDSVSSLSLTIIGTPGNTPEPPGPSQPPCSQ